MKRLVTGRVGGLARRLSAFGLLGPSRFRSILFVGRRRQPPIENAVTPRGRLTPAPGDDQDLRFRAPKKVWDRESIFIITSVAVTVEKTLFLCHTFRKASVPPRSPS
jgi:hypothetical protein